MTLVICERTLHHIDPIHLMDADWWARLTGATMQHYERVEIERVRLVEVERG